MTTNFPEWKSAEIIVGLEGSGKVKAPGSPPVAFTCGEAVVVPASFEEFEVYTQHGVEILAVCLPLTVDPTAGPATDRLEPLGT